MRNDKPWNEGCASVTRCDYSIEGVLQQGAKSVGKVKKTQGKDKEAVKATEQSLTNSRASSENRKREEQIRPQPEAQAGYC